MNQKFKIENIIDLQDQSLLNISKQCYYINEMKHSNRQKKTSKYSSKEFSQKNQNQQDFISKMPSMETENLSLKNSSPGVPHNQAINKIKTTFNSMFKFKGLSNQRKKLKRIISREKVKNINEVFTSKLIRSIPNSCLVDYDFAFKEQTSGLFNKFGLSLNFHQEIIKTVFSALTIFLIFILFSGQIIFSNLSKFAQVQIGKIVIILLLTSNIVLNFVCVRKLQGKTIQILKQIIKLYLKQSFLLDLSCLVALLIDICVDMPQLKYLRLIFLIKISDFRKDVAKLDYHFVNNFYKQQYWRLARLIISNFFFAHVISLVLLIVAGVDPENNWLIKSNHHEQGELQKYIWAYYWSVTTMLSVGYGDIVAANCKQAICLIIIQSVSCICLAYTINCVGELISNLRFNQLEKVRNFKILRQITKNNQIDRSIEQKIGNYIEDSSETKKKYNYDQQNQFIKKLPTSIKSDLLKQCNEKLFMNISIVKSFHSKVIRQLAQKIQLFICNPEQMVFQQPNCRQIIILKQGHLGYYARRFSCASKYLLNQLKVQSQENSQPVHLNFITQAQLNYKVKPFRCSLIQKLSYDTFIECIKKFTPDFETFCQQKDKYRLVPDQYQTIPCIMCKQKKHVRISCPKLHYIPFRSIIVSRYFHKKKIQKTQRYEFNRTKQNLPENHPYKLYAKNKSLYQKQSLPFYLYTELNSLSQYNIQQMVFQYCKYKYHKYLTENDPSISFKNPNDFQKFFNKKQRNEVQNPNQMENIPKSSRNRLHTKFKNGSYKMLPSYQHFKKQVIGSDNINKIENLLRHQNNINKVNSIFLQLLEPDYHQPQNERKIKSKNVIMTQQYLQQMFGIACDALHNYKFYFSECNAKNMKKKHIGKAMAGKKKMVQYGLTQIPLNI